jgi:prevent-host-death family protein
MDVGVRELKAKLSEYLDRAARGELIRVTDRGKPKALLGPLPEESAIERGIREGWIRPGSGQRPTIPRARFKGSRPSGDVLREDRDDE